MARMVRFILLLAVLAAIPLMAACVPTSIGGVISTAQTGIMMVKAGHTFNDMQEFRSQPTPLAGTWEVTYAFPNDEVRTVYVRTLENKNVPWGGSTSSRLDMLNPNTGMIQFSGYLTHSMGGFTLDAVPDSATVEVPVVAALMVEDSLGVDESGAHLYNGQFLVTVRESEDADARELWDLIDQFVNVEGGRTKGAIRVYPDGSAVGQAVYETKAGRTIVDARRLDTVAYAVSDEATRQYTAGEMLQGWKSALTGEDPNQD